MLFKDTLLLSAAELADVGCLFSLGALGYLKFDFLAFFQSFIAFSFDCGMVDEYVLTVFAGDKAITLLIAEPLHFAICHFVAVSPPSMSTQLTE